MLLWFQVRMALTIVSVAPSSSTVSPDAWGEAERAIDLLDQKLREAGHHSIVIADPRSTVAGTLVPAVTREDRLAALREVLERHAVDVVHLHDADFVEDVPEPGPPVLVTLHGPADSYPDGVRSPRRPLTFPVCVSRFARAQYPPDAPMAVIPMGVPLERYAAGAAREAFALAMGPLCPEKGFHLALDAAHRAGLPLVLAGPLCPEHMHYFDEQIRPLLDAERRFVGEVGAADRVDLLSRARCLVVPSLVQDVGCYPALEALASGTPVVGTTLSALSEVVEPGMTGLFVESVPEMARALFDAQRLDHEACRRRAESRFSAQSMFESYLGVYETLAAVRSQGLRPASGFPLTTRRLSGLAALEALVPAWSELWERCPEATPFQHPAWVIPWAAVFAEEREVLSLAVYRGAELLGLLPLYHGTEEGSSVLRILGSGSGGVLDLLAAPVNEADVVESLLSALRELPAWDLCVLGPFAEGSPLQDAAGLVVGADLAPAGAVPSLPLLPPFLEERLPDQLPSRLREGRLRAARAGWIGVETITPRTLDAALEALFSPPLANESEKVRSFYWQSARPLLESGLLRLYVLRFDRAEVAVYYGLHAHGRAYSCHGGEDPAFAWLNPGDQLVEHALRQAAREGAHEIDLLAADPRAWGARRRPLWQLTLRRPTAGPVLGSADVVGHVPAAPTDSR